MQTRSRSRKSGSLTPAPSSSPAQQPAVLKQEPAPSRTPSPFSAPLVEPEPVQEQTTSSAPADQFTTRTKRVKSQKKKKSRSAFSAVLAGLVHITLINYLLYFAFVKCPSDPDHNPTACPKLNSLTAPLRDAEFTQQHITPYLVRAQASYDKLLAPSVAQVGELAQKQYDLYAKDRVESIKDSLKEYTPADVKAALQTNCAVFTEKAVEASKYAKQQAVPMARVFASKSHRFVQLVWLHVKIVYNKYILFYARSIYHDRVENVISRVTEKVLHAETSSFVDVDSNTENAAATASDSTATSSHSIAPVTSTSNKQLSAATPYMTPKAEPEDEAHLELIQADILSWNEKFRSSGKSAISSLSEDLEGLFDEARVALRDAGRTNLTVASDKIETVLGSESAQTTEGLQYILSDILLPTADKVRSAAVEAANAVLREAELTRNSTLDIFRTVTNVGLHELARKWAVMDGITWKDWKEFKLLRDMVDDFAQVIESIPIDTSVVRSALNHVDGEIDAWIQEVEDKIEKLLDEARLREEKEKAKSSAMEEGVADDDVDDKDEDDEDDYGEDEEYDEDEELEHITSTLTSTVTIVRSVPSSSDDSSSSSLDSSPEAVHDEL